MAATITWDGTNGAGSDGVVSTADSLTGWNTIKITSGGQKPTAALADGQIEGTGAVTCVSNNKRVCLYVDIGSGNTLDFTSGGNAEGEMLYTWGNFLASGLLQINTTGGFGIFLESSTPATAQYHLWYFYGSDNYSGGWKRMVLDPNEPSSASAGTAIDLTAVRYFGVFGDTSGTARFDNLICDQIAVGKGLIVTGTSTTDALVQDLLDDELTNRHGVITALNDSGSSVELNGNLTLGDSGTAASTMTDVDSKIFLAEPIYYDGTSLTNAVPVDFFNLAVVGGTGTNSITIGKAVGTEEGRNGWSLVGNTTYDLGLDFDNGSVNTSAWYGSSFTDVTGTIVMGTNTAHKFFSDSFTGCEQVDPQGGVEIKNLTIVGTASTAGGVLWNDSIDMTLSKFIANTAGAAVEHPSSTNSPFDHSALTYSGNTFDVNNTSGSAITVNKLSGSDPSTSTGSAVTFAATYALTLTDLVDTTRVLIVNSSTRVVLSDQVVTATGILTYSHSGGEIVDIMPTHVDYKIDASSIYDLTLDNANQSIKFAQADDLFYSNP